ncbi:hypothetical protein FVE85_5215 [Porphyridium purpureum]|uniref:Uncharacterized protein n=1 Tax=Porphyridium purpureum TaxID=35688 RepID=A0A5J4Z2Y4_PORPP|nr:hypothetical protein FVE85_5215 [Porphyridium purpureum]|eukprot:POR1939..scf295_1
MGFVSGLPTSAKARVAADVRTCGSQRTCAGVRGETRGSVQGGSSRIHKLGVVVLDVEQAIRSADAQAAAARRSDPFAGTPQRMVGNSGRGLRRLARTPQRQPTRLCHTTGLSGTPLFGQDLRTAMSAIARYESFLGREVPLSERAELQDNDIIYIAESSALACRLA